MNLAEKLIHLLHHEEPGKLTPERLAQYSKVLDDDQTAIESISQKEWSVPETQSYFESFRDKILANNFNLATVVGCPTVIQVNNWREITGAKKTADEHAVVIDSFVTTLLWTMNKAWTYGKELERGDQDILFYNLFLHFATLRKFREQGFVWPRPKTPPHSEMNGLVLLNFITGSQESFLIAHELAHFYVDRGGPVPEDMVFKKTSIIDRLVTRDTLINQELMADELAFDFVLKCYQENESIEVVAVTSIFLLIRYHLWLAFVCSSGEGDRDFTLWLARNNLFREKARQICCNETLHAIVEVSELLEEAFEPAALRAKESFNLISDKIGGPS